MHPDDVQWMLYLYRECSPAERQQMEDHLAICSECQSRLEEFQDVQDSLSNWTVSSSASVAASSTTGSAAEPGLSVRSEFSRRPEAVTNPVTGSSAVRLRTVVVSAAVVLGAFSLGQWFASPSVPDLAQLKKELRHEVQEELSRSMQTEIQNYVNAKLETLTPDRQSLVPLIESESGRIVAAQLASLEKNDESERVELERLMGNVLQNQIALRNDLERLAVEAETQILNTRREILKLAGTTMQPSVMTPEGMSQGQTGQEF